MLHFESGKRKNVSRGWSKRTWNCWGWPAKFPSATTCIFHGLPWLKVLAFGESFYDLFWLSKPVFLGCSCWQFWISDRTIPFQTLTSCICTTHMRYCLKHSYSKEPVPFSTILWLRMVVQWLLCSPFRKSFRMAPPLFHSIWNNIVSNYLNEISLFVKMSEKVVAPYGKLSSISSSLVIPWMNISHYSTTNPSLIIAKWHSGLATLH